MKYSCRLLNSRLNFPTLPQKKVECHSISRVLIANRAKNPEAIYALFNSIQLNPEKQSIYLNKYTVDYDAGQPFATYISKKRKKPFSLILAFFYPWNGYAAK